MSCHHSDKKPAFKLSAVSINLFSSGNTTDDMPWWKICLIYIKIIKTVNKCKSSIFFFLASGKHCLTYIWKYSCAEVSIVSVNVNTWVYECNVNTAVLMMWVAVGMCVSPGTATVMVSG